MLFLDKHRQKIIPLLAALCLLITVPALVAAPAVKQETQDSAKRRMARAENFLLRAYEELAESLAYEKAGIETLEKRYAGSARRVPGIREFLDWYRNVAAWLRERLSESESDLENFYSRRMIRPALAGRYSKMAEDYARLAEQFAEKARHLEEAKGLNAAKIEKQLKIIEYYEYITEQAEKKKIAEENRSPDRKPPDDWILYYKDINDEEIKRMRINIGVLQDLQKDLDVLLELGRYETNWLSLKSDDSAALSSVARAVMGDSLDMIEAAAGGIITQYEADISFIEKKVREIDGKRTGLTGAVTGTMRSLDRVDEIWDYYITMKTRFEHHIQWLKEQVGAYRADIVLLEKERRE